MTSLLIRGGTVLDGSGAPGRPADVLVRDGRIAMVGPVPQADRPTVVLDAGGLVVAPGFIDMHSHADYTLPSYPGALSSLAQGVTTEVIGNCGFSPAPLSDVPSLAEATRAAGRGLGPGLDWRWRGFGEYLDVLAAARPAVNCVPLVGFGSVRHAVMGAEDRPASREERHRMRSVVREALADGAWGMSTGLVYPPGSFARADEVIAVAEALVPSDGLYTSHIRNEHDGLLGALEEAVSVGRRLGVRVQVSHLKAAGHPNHGHVAAALDLLDDARAEGVRVTQDVYPYVAASTLLSQLVPPWVHEGGPPELVARLHSVAVRERIAAEIATGLPGWSNYAAAAGGWQGILIASVVDPVLRHLEGLRVDEAARRAGVEPLELVLDTLIADRASTTMIMFLMDQADVDLVASHPMSAIGSDQLGVTSREARVHPRAYGSFARVLAMAREGRLLDLATAVGRMTGTPARILGLGDRGRVAAGAIADLVLFDPATVTDRATYRRPTLLPSGVDTVIVNGTVAVSRGEPVDVHAGRVLRRGPVQGVVAGVAGSRISGGPNPRRC